MRMNVCMRVRIHNIREMQFSNAFSMYSCGSTSFTLGAAARTLRASGTGVGCTVCCSGWFALDGWEALGCTGSHPSFVSSKPCSTVGVLTSMHGMRFEKRGEGSWAIRMCWCSSLAHSYLLDPSSRARQSRIGPDCLKKIAPLISLIGKINQKENGWTWAIHMRYNLSRLYHLTSDWLSE